MQIKDLLESLTILCYYNDRYKIDKKYNLAYNNLINYMNENKNNIDKLFELLYVAMELATTFSTTAFTFIGHLIKSISRGTRIDIDDLQNEFNEYTKNNIEELKKLKIDGKKYIPSNSEVAKIESIVKEKLNEFIENKSSIFNNLIGNTNINYIATNPLIKRTYTIELILGVDDINKINENTEELSEFFLSVIKKINPNFSIILTWQYKESVKRNEDTDEIESVGGSSNQNHAIIYCPDVNNDSFDW